MSNKKPPIPQCPTLPVEEEIEEDLKTIDETEAPLLTDDAKVLLESIGTEVLRNDLQETAQKLADNVDELEQTIATLDKKHNELMTCEKELEEIEEEIDRQIKEMNNYISEIQSNATPAVK
ncbi:uncharacterized protein LOC100164805 [Acyrthosiphon pisum]|uniref:ACYPI005792 protein n=1 Tax=Acyrthosiphon pisum TaxID=7029 RepID=C4WRI9_ACYPI|nr:uncharacterized protein LOC100164805 [Acyrthosiphon pisum]BAH70509.1 ACYPI005792 [Acyrthosiphon pisum]|eukprot:NP_001156194.1 uncharacterized protein LOC100164805 [Acyrthosiphon pisum]